MKNFGKTKNDFANMPQEIVHEKISKMPCYGEQDYDDTMSGIDEKVNSRISKAKKQNNKY